MTKITIRPSEEKDIPGLAKIAEGKGLFPPETIPDFLGPVLEGTSPNIWLTCLDGDAPVGLCLAAPEIMTDRTWNMLALGILPDRQGGGLGAALVADLERRLADRGERLLIVDTSGTEYFALARQFYLKIGYSFEARIRDFWGDGDDKITYAKRLR